LARFYKKTGSSYFVAFAANQLYAASVSGTFVSVSSDPIVSGAVQTARYRDQLYFTNLSNIVRAFDGSAIKDVGLSGPTFRKQIADFETNETWGSGTADTAFMRIDHGDQALMLSTSSTTSGFIRADCTISANLTRFASDVSSDGQDLIRLYTVHRSKTSVSTIDLLIDCDGGDFSSISGDCYRKRLTDLSSWVSVSADAWGIAHIIPKDTFDSPSSGYSWSTVRALRLEMVQAGSSPAICSFDNIRMEKTPPIPVPGEYVPVGEESFWGSAKGGGKQPQNATGWPRFVEEKDAKDQPTQGTTHSGKTSGLMYYKSTFYKADADGIQIESNPSYQSSSVMVSMNASTRVSIVVNNIPLAPSSWGDVGRNIYRRKNTEIAYRYVHGVQDNYTTAFTDNVPDSLLGRALEDDHWPPPNAKFIYMAGDQRTYYYNLIETGVAYPSRVRWSYYYEPHYVPLENAIDIAPEDSSEGTGIFEYKGIIHFLKQRSTWMLDESTTLTNVHPTIGCVAPRSIAEGQDQVFWLSEQGIIMYSLSFNNISRRPGRKGDITEIINRLPTAYLENAAGVYYNGFYLLAVTDEGATENNLVLSYHVESDTWSTFPSLNVNCWSTWTGGKDGYRLFFGNNSGQVCEFFTGNTDLGYSIPSTIKTKDFGLPTPSNSWRYANIFTESLDSEDRSIKMEPYFDKETTASEAQVAGVSGVYGITKYSLPQRDDASFCSIKLSSSGRYRLVQLDLYGKEESLR